MSTKRQILGNDVRLLTDELPWCNSVMLVACLLGGSGDETQETIGLTHLLEHMLFKRVGDQGPAELAKEMDRLGSEVSAFTDFDSLCLHCHVSSEKSADALKFMVKMIANSNFVQTDLDNEKGVIRQEIIDNTDDPNEAVYSSFMQHFWPDSPLGWLVHGTHETLNSFSIQDLEDRRKQLLRGKRVIIGAVGKFDKQELAALCEELFESGEENQTKSLAPSPVQPGLYFAPKPVNQVYFSMGCKFPGVVEPEFEAATLVNFCFGEGISSRLFQTLREDHGLAYDVSSEIDSYADTSAFLLNLQTEPSNFDKAFKLISSELKKLKEQGLSNEEFERSRALKHSHLKVDSDSISRRLWRMIETEIYFEEPFSMAKQQLKLNSLTLTEINHFLNKYLTDAKFVLVLGGAQEEANFSSGASLGDLF